MVVCGSCGGQNPADRQFCTHCNVYLKWYLDDPAQAYSGQGNREPLRSGRSFQSAVALLDSPLAICGACQLENPAERVFCGRCASRLRQVKAARRPGWWRRGWRRLRTRRIYAAGQRKRDLRPNRTSKRLTILAVLAVVVVLLYGQITEVLRPVSDFVLDRITPQQVTTPISAQASSSEGAHAPGLILDGTVANYWAPTIGQHLNAWVQVTFAEPTELRSIIVTTGISERRRDFLTQGRPHELLVEVSDSDGEVVSEYLYLSDRTGGQRFVMRVDDSVSVKLTVNSAYGDDPGRLVALSEVEFFIQD